MVDISRSTSGVNLPSQVASEIWSSAQEQSAVMAVSRQIALPGSGITIPIITGDAQADWVAETAEKPLSRPTLGNKQMTPYKLAVIVPFSDEFRRDVPGLYSELARRLPGALAKKFDETVLAGSAPGSNFDVLSSGVTDLEVGGDNSYQELVDIFTGVAVSGGNVSHWVASPTLQGTLLGAVDGFGRPLYTQSANTDNNVGQVLGRPVYGTRANLNGRTGVAGDFAGSAFYGTVSGVQVSVSDQATLTDGVDGTINLWQQNMFAIRAEIEVGFIVRDKSHFRGVVAPAEPEVP